MPEINESTKISLPIKAVWAISIAFLAATVWLMGLYGEVKKVPEDLEAKDEEWKENRYFGLRENAYACECERLTNAHPGRIFVVRIVDGF